MFLLSASKALCCTECSENFKFRFLLVRHLNEHHPSKVDQSLVLDKFQANPPVCEAAPVSYMPINPDQTQSSINLSNKSIAGPFGLEQDVSLDAEDPFDPQVALRRFPCSHCDMKFQKKINLIKHLKEVNTENALRLGRFIKLLSFHGRPQRGARGGPPPPGILKSGCKSNLT